MQKVSENGIALIKQYEGFSPLPYLCPAGKPTIGYGHVIKPKERYPESGITVSDAEALLKSDVEFAEQAINRLVRTKLKQAQFDALVSLVFNIGAGAFEHSTLLKCLNKEDHANAAKQFLRWVFAAGKKMPGLVLRRQAELKLFQSA